MEKNYITPFFPDLSKKNINYIINCLITFDKKITKKMKHYKLAEGTINLKDYQVMINFLKKRKILTQSENTKKFEKKFSKYLGRNYSVFVNSGSSANLLIAQTLLEGNF